jgi:TctA family transporter
MRFGRPSLVGAIFGALMLTTPGVANAMTVRVSGRITETSRRTCGEPVWAGYVATIQPSG